MTKPRKMMPSRLMHTLTSISAGVAALMSPAHAATGLVRFPCGTCTGGRGNKDNHSMMKMALTAFRRTRPAAALGEMMMMVLLLY